MTCATCARIARRVAIARASAASPTRSTPSGSRARCSRTRCCPGRSSAPPAAAGPDEPRELLMLWHRARRSIKTSRQHLLNEAEHLLAELPLELREQLPDTKAVRPRLRALGASRPPARATPRPRCGCGCSMTTGSAIARARRRRTRRLPRARHARQRQRQHARRALRPRRPARSPNCWSRSATRAASPRPASRASTPPRRSRPRPPRAPANPSATATTPAATAASTPSCTAWPSPSCAANRAPKRSTPTPANAATPRKRPRRILKRHLSDVIHRRMLRDLAAQGLLTEPPRASASPVKPQHPTAATTSTGLAARANLEQEARP